MLFFELFPAFMLAVAVAAMLGLFVADRRARLQDRKDAAAERPRPAP
jgi:hypothetical protein